MKTTEPGLPVMTLKAPVAFDVLCAPAPTDAKQMIINAMNFRYGFDVAQSVRLRCASKVSAPGAAQAFSLRHDSR
jgi:hypothetical protein